MSDINRLVTYNLNSLMENDMSSKEDYFIKRTNEHIARVQENLKFMLKSRPDLDSEIISNKIETHDASKFSPEEYEGYIHITEKYRPGSGYQATPESQKLMDGAWDNHQKVNSHHPEYHKNINDMTKEDIAEMVADWAAMSQEKNNSLKEWADNVLSGKYEDFSDKNKELILDYVSIF